MDRFGKLSRGLNIDALHHTVAADVGVNDCRNPFILELQRQLLRGMVGALSPAVHRDHTVPGIDADDDLARKLGAELGDEFGAIDRHGAENHVTDAGLEIGFDGFDIADAAANLDRKLWKRGAYFLDDIGIDGFALEGAIEIDQMQALATLCRPLAGHGHRVVGKHGALIHIALTQAHAMAFFQINCRNQNHD